MYTPPPDFVLRQTADGSFTLRSNALDEQYHSVYGAVQESRHVYLAMGLDHLRRSDVDLLEVGLGTGLNALLTWIAADDREITVRYTALEPYPLPAETLSALDHAAACGRPEKRDAGLAMLTAAEGEWRRVSPHFIFRRIPDQVQALELENTFDLVYFDAFGPATQPELWTLDVFQRIRRAMRPGAVLVTYCAKGDVRRAMNAAGLTTERLKGPPGKLQMLRATGP